jgi:nicotinate-nucleotide pyrophosphorylase (carboxylating)
MADFQQLAWDDDLLADWDRLLDLAIREDLGGIGDLTTMALVPEDAHGRAAVVPRRPGVVAGLAAVEATLHRFDSRLQWSAEATDGQTVAKGQPLGRIEGPARALLTAERPLLNLLGRLSGIATLTRKYVEAVAGTRARIYDTRKTTPGWRRLEKYAVRCGGGRNHRSGLFEAVLIKDNHLAFGAGGKGGEKSCVPFFSPAEAVTRAREFLEREFGPTGREVIVEVEVDTLEQLDEVLTVRPDLVLLDNMGPEVLRQAVARRDARRPETELEASGGIDLDTIRRVAESGVNRISVGALTHSAVWLDIGLDWDDKHAR